METLEQSVEAVISREIARHNLKLRDVDASKVDWDDIISRSVRRKLPFDPGEKEKGFRDAVILETFKQIIAELPKSPQSCRIVLMSGDQLLVDAAQEVTNDRSNVACMSDVEAIQTMLNALASALTQEVVDKVLPAASKLFWTKGDEATLYYKEKITAAISSQFKTELASVPTGFTLSNAKQILIRDPAFLAKANQRLTFSSRITHSVEATKIVWRSQPESRGLLSGLATAALPTTTVSQASGLGTANLGTFGALAPSATLPGMLTYPPPPPPPPSPSPPPVADVVRREGKHVFEVFWTAILTASGSLKTPRLEKIEYKESTWTEDP